MYFLVEAPGSCRGRSALALGWRVRLVFFDRPRGSSTA